MGRRTIGDVQLNALRWVPPYSLQRGAAVLMVVLQCAIAVTGSTVRVTASGLGCPTWPRCTPTSLVPEASPTIDPIRVWIEFGNRMLGIVVGVVSVAVFVIALLSRPGRRRYRLLALTMPLGVVAQGVIGGITVLAELQWWTVSLHFLVTPVLIWLSVLHLRAVGEGDAPPRWLLPRSLRGLLLAMAGALAAVLVAGTLVTAAGPHGGDADVHRLGLPIVTLTQVHGDLLVLLVGMLAAFGFTLRAVSATATLWRRYAVLVAVVLAQGLVGFVQYLTGVPEALVMAHVAGATVVTVCMAALWCAARDRGPRPATRAPGEALVGAGR